LPGCYPKGPVAHAAGPFLHCTGLLPDALVIVVRTVWPNLTCCIPPGPKRITLCCQWIGRPARAPALNAPHSPMGSPSRRSREHNTPSRVASGQPGPGDRAHTDASTAGSPRRAVHRALFRRLLGRPRSHIGGWGAALAAQDHCRTGSRSLQAGGCEHARCTTCNKKPRPSGPRLSTSNRRGAEHRPKPARLVEGHRVLVPVHAVAGIVVETR